MWSAIQLNPPALFWFGKRDKIYPIVNPLRIPRISVAYVAWGISLDHFFQLTSV